jgi:hypothetical protein
MIKNRYLILLLLFFCGNSLFAQSVPAWGGGADQEDLSFGFSFSYVSSYYKIDKRPNWRNPFIDKDGTPVKDSLRSINSANTPGFAVGFLTRYRITDHLEARITPSLIFADRNLNYVYSTPAQNVSKSVQASMVEVPLSLKLKSDRIGNFRAYLLGGVKFSKSLSNKVNADADFAPEDKLVKNISGFTSYETGLGCDIYFEYFKMSPEIKLSNSFGNVLLHDNNAFSSPIDKLSLHTIMFSLYFE